MRPAITTACAVLFIYLCSSCTQLTNKDFFVSVDDYKIYVEENGKGDPIILLHEGLLDHRMWEDIVGGMEGVLLSMRVESPRGEVVHGGRDGDANMTVDLTWKP